MARKTKEEALETRERILDAATLIFSEKGVGQSSLEDIAEAAGVTRGAVYWHFKNKMDVFSALHQRAHTCVADLLVDGSDIPAGDPLRRLEEICIENLTDLFRNDETKRLFSIFILKCDYSGDSAQFLTEQNRRKCEKLPLLTEYFEKSLKMGLISSKNDPEMLALSLCCYMCGIYGEYLRNPDALDLETRIIPMIRVYFEGLRCAGKVNA